MRARRTQHSFVSAAGPCVQQGQSPVRGRKDPFRGSQCVAIQIDIHTGGPGGTGEEVCAISRFQPFYAVSYDNKSYSSTLITYTYDMGMCASAFWDLLLAPTKRSKRASFDDLLLLGNCSERDGLSSFLRFWGRPRLLAAPGTPRSLPPLAKHSAQFQVTNSGVIRKISWRPLGPSKPSLLPNSQESIMSHQKS